ncbi:uncharacterized protein C10orf67 homolog, mitochondrial [Sphaerodactylus townsendi]|uniref:uncharacterized protein C10orf67 homolog, mitochondrial n=1 Tax=Sphaerodactylus townsendi TaxID=933632 RepID=UPI0020264C46|nr:uncharacterized protein C10orf67 homolog, mitochondrial [Sphaerodactylus townsendi]
MSSRLRKRSNMAGVDSLHGEQERSFTERVQAILVTGRLSISPHILELLALPTLEDLEADYRPRISDDLKIGYAISDRATQTDGSEITDLKEFIVTTKTLIEFTNSVYDDFMRYKSFLNAQYEEKIKDHAFNLWEEMNDRLEYIEKVYKEKEVKMRYSYQKQLCDALAILQICYAKYISVSKGLSGEEEESLAERFQKMGQSLEEKDVIIAGLEEEIVAYKAKESKKFLYVEDDEFEKELLQQENKEMRAELVSLNGKLARLQEAMKQKEKDYAEMDAEIRQLQDKRERDLKTIEKLMNTQEILKLEVEREQQRVLSKAREVKEAQDALARLTESIAKSEVEAAVAAKVQAFQQQKEKKMAKDRREAEAREAEAREAAREAKKETAAAAASKPSEEREAAGIEISFDSPQEMLSALYGSNKEAASKALLSEVARLKKSEREARERAKSLELEIHHLSEAWELKFQILKRSFRVRGGNGGTAFPAAIFFTPIVGQSHEREKMLGGLIGSTLTLGLPQRVFFLARKPGYFCSLADL